MDLTSVLAPSMSRLVSPCPPSSATSPGSHLRRPSSLPTQTLQLGLYSAAVLQCPHPATHLQSTAARSATAVLLLQHSPAATRALQRLGYSSLQGQGEADTSVASNSTNMPTHQSALCTLYRLHSPRVQAGEEQVLSTEVAYSTVPPQPRPLALNHLWKSLTDLPLCFSFQNYFFGTPSIYLKDASNDVRYVYKN